MSCPRPLAKLIALQKGEKIIACRGLTLEESQVNVTSGIAGLSIEVVIVSIMIPSLIYVGILVFLHMESVTMGRITGIIMVVLVALVALLVIFLRDVSSTVKASSRLLYIYTVVTSKRLIEIEHTDDTRHIYVVNNYYEGILRIRVQLNVDSKIDTCRVMILMKDNSSIVRSWPTDLAYAFIKASRKYLFDEYIRTRRKGGVYL